MAFSCANWKGCRIYGYFFSKIREARLSDFHKAEKKAHQNASSIGSRKK
jgi:hypothetical protein